MASDLAERCRELLAWRNTGLLSGRAIRDLADTLTQYNEDDRIPQAELLTVREALTFTAGSIAPPASANMLEIIRPRPVENLDDYWQAVGLQGPLGAEWDDKPHRLIYDLIAAVLYYTRVAPVTTIEKGSPMAYDSSAAAILAQIADAYDASGLDEARPEWRLSSDSPENTVLFTGRGGKTLLTLGDCFRAREALRAPAAAPEPLFPIIDAQGIPWSLIAPYEAQAQKNHSQSLKRLAERGGLSMCEAMAVMSSVSWDKRPIAKPTVRDWLDFLAEHKVRAARRITLSQDVPVLTAEDVTTIVHDELVQESDGPADRTKLFYVGGTGPLLSTYREYVDLAGIFAAAMQRIETRIRNAFNGVRS